MSKLCGPCWPIDSVYRIYHKAAVQQSERGLDFFSSTHVASTETVGRGHQHQQNFGKLTGSVAIEFFVFPNFVAVTAAPSSSKLRPLLLYGQMYRSPYFIGMGNLCGDLWFRVGAASKWSDERQQQYAVYNT